MLVSELYDAFERILNFPLAPNEVFLPRSSALIGCIKMHLIQLR